MQEGAGKASPEEMLQTLRRDGLTPLCREVIQDREFYLREGLCSLELGIYEEHRLALW